jgi:FkbH-like protein
MKLIEALEVMKGVESEATRLRILLACGFTPLHLQNFLSAELLIRTPNKRPEIERGLFGDLAGTIERLEPRGIENLVVVIEWSDIDPRLAARSLGGWRVSQMASIIDSAHGSIARLQRAIARASAQIPTVVCPPSLPLPPMFTTQRTEESSPEAQLRCALASFVENLSQQSRLCVVNTQYLDEMSPLAGRYDVKSDLSSGFPYTLQHASAVAKILADVIHPCPPKKGLITDLDDTLWAGILGDDGAEGISWDLEHKSQMHGLYQQVLASLASAGVLVGVASKNDPSAVRSVFEKRNLPLTQRDIFPLETHWSRKPDSVARILKIWNISADSVVFVDDSPMEVAEVQTAFPDMECIVFPKRDYQAIWELLRHLRDSFGRSAQTGEDVLRTASIRQAEIWRELDSSSENLADDFLKSADSHIVFHTSEPAADQRAFELVNKTNQFNLNGKRFSEGEWRNLLSDPAAFLVTASYKDKFGPLGKIAVIIGKSYPAKVYINSWVMSCRAFSRRIEYRCLQYIFDALGADEIVFDYEATPRNTPLQEFLAALSANTPVPGIGISKRQFLARVPRLFHVVEEDVHV